MSLRADSPEFVTAAIDKPGEQGLSDALGGEIVEHGGLRATMSQAFGYPGPLVIIPFVTVIADQVPVAWKVSLLLGCQIVFACAYALNLPRTIRRNFLHLRDLGWLRPPTIKA